MTIGECIKQIRMDSNLSQIELGIRAGLKREYICIIEKNDLPNPTVITLEKIIKALGISPSEFFIRKEKG